MRETFCGIKRLLCGKHYKTYTLAYAYVYYSMLYMCILIVFYIFIYLSFDSHTPLLANWQLLDA